MNDKCKDELLKAKILESAENLFSRWGYKKTSMEDIAKASGKAKSTLYYYYNSKNEIFEALFTTKIDIMVSAAYTKANKYSSYIEKFQHYIIESFKEMKNRVNVNTILVSELKFENQILEKMLEIFDGKEQKILKKIYMEGIKNGEFKKFSNEEVEIITEQIVRTIRHLEVDTFVNQNTKLDDKRIKLLADLILNGLSK